MICKAIRSLITIFDGFEGNSSIFMFLSIEPLNNDVDDIHYLR